MTPKQEKKVLRTFFTNKYLIEKYFAKELFSKERRENLNRETAEPAVILKYSKSDPEFSDFAVWLDFSQASDNFNKFAVELIEIDKKLAVEPVGKACTELVKRRYNIIDVQ